MTVIVRICRIEQLIIAIECKFVSLISSEYGSQMIIPACPPRKAPNHQVDNPCLTFSAILS